MDEMIVLDPSALNCIIFYILHEELYVLLWQDLLGKSEVERGVDFYGVFWRYFHVATASTLEEATLYQVPPTEVKHPVLHDVPLRYRCYQLSLQFTNKISLHSVTFSSWRRGRLPGWKLRAELVPVSRLISDQRSFLSLDMRNFRGDFTDICHCVNCLGRFHLIRIGKTLYYVLCC